MDLQLTGKIALVTGATAGIGLEIARTLGKVVARPMATKRKVAASWRFPAMCGALRLDW